MNSDGDQLLYLSANLGNGEATHQGGVYIDACTDDEMQIWKTGPVVDAAPYFRLILPALGNKICLEGNNVAQESYLEGASFLTGCQNASGQFWILNKVVP